MSAPDPRPASRGSLRLILVVVGLGLLFGGAGVLLLTPLTLLGLAMVAAAIIVRVVSTTIGSIDRLHARLSSPPAWWYNPKTHQVADGRFAPGPRWDGPYASQQDAARAPEIARSRAAEWNSED